MRKRIAAYGLWAFLACVLAFFENRAGTRIILLCTLLLPLVPSLRRGIFPARIPEPPEAARRAGPAAPSPEDEKPGLPRTLPEGDPSGGRSPADALFSSPEEEPGEIRDWRPGDPARLIHWKLSAKRDLLLVRDVVPEPAPGRREPEKIPGEKPRKPRSLRQRLRLLLLCLAAAAPAVLLLVPGARFSLFALGNRVFEESERLNAYAYARLPVPAGCSTVPAAVLLGAAFLSLLGLAALSRRLWPSLLAAALVVLPQVYFGLPLPDAVSVPLFALLAWKLLQPPRSRKALRALAVLLLGVSLGVLALYPGVNGAVEEASERVRDALSQSVGQWSGSVREEAGGAAETRHIHSRSLSEGTGEADPEKEYRLVTVEEVQVSMPDWINLLRAALMLLLAVALLVLPFLPFIWFNSRRKKVRRLREAFEAEDPGAAVQAAFQHVVSWLEAAGRSAGNLPYVRWTEQPDRFAAPFPEGYSLRFGRCAALFEEAAYSAHALSESDRRQVLSLLEETEQAVLAGTDRREKLRLKYGKCLY